MAEKPTRREVIVQIAAGTAASGTLAPIALQAQSSYQPQNLSAAQYELLTVLVDMVIPPSDTPGASAAGVNQFIDETLGSADENRKPLAAGLDTLAKAGFTGMDESARVKLLTEYSEASDQRGDFFRALKNMTIDGYYTSEIGLVQELGYQGNTYLREFPGCQHEEHK